jgi:fibrillarin-like pre-rRNA processing protein
MRRASELPASSENARLRLRKRSDRTELWTETDAAPIPVYGERWIERNGRAYREFDPNRSKLAAGILRGWQGPIPRVGERWLYLGAASGTTASHVADLLGPEGSVYAVERSLRPFARLVALAERWPGLLPILGDARAPHAYLDLVPPVDGVYADIAQPDQIEIVRANAREFLRGTDSAIVLALKTASMGRDASAAGHLHRAESGLEEVVDLDPSVKLDPFHRGHFLVGGRPRRALFSDAPTRSGPAPRVGSPERRRR